MQTKPDSENKTRRIRSARLEISSTMKSPRNLALPSSSQIKNPILSK